MHFLSQAWGAGSRAVGPACCCGAMVPSQSRPCPLQCGNTFSVRTGARVLFLPGVARRLGDRFLVPSFGVARCALSSPWLKRNERLRQGSFSGIPFGSYSSRMGTGHAVWCG